MYRPRSPQYIHHQMLPTTKMIRLMMMDACRPFWTNSSFLQRDHQECHPQALHWKAFSITVGFVKKKFVYACPTNKQLSQLISRIILTLNNILPIVDIISLLLSCAYHTRNLSRSYFRGTRLRDLGHAHCFVALNALGDKAVVAC